MKKNVFGNYIFILILIATMNIFAQTVPFNSSRWDVSADKFETGNYFGKDGVFLKDGGALVKGSEFLNGIIEFDIAVTGERGFMGVLWRMQDGGNGEEFYIRPHQSGNPDANQYTPIFNGITSWQLYYGDEYSAPVKYNLNEWMHIKIIISGQQAEVYIIDMEKPALFIPELKRKAERGEVGIYAGSGFAPAYYSDFSFKEIDNPVFKSKPVIRKSAVKGTVMSWDISNAFDSGMLNNKYEISWNDIKDLKWTTLKCEKSGIANIARLQGISKNSNPAFAKLVINSEKAQIKKLKFGYSDNVKVFVNGRVIYGGTNFYTSRDYRYLGTIGLFDEIYLNLKEGENTILFAVTESFGGWGILGAFDDLSGIKIGN